MEEKNGFDVQVEVPPGEVRDQINDFIDNISVVKTDPIDRRHEGCSEQDACYNEQVFDDTPGGVTFDNATSCCQYYVDYDSDGIYESTLLTASHVVGIGCSSYVGDSVEQHCESWGEVVEDYPRIDVAACQPTENGKSANNIIKGEYSDFPLSGFVTESGLEDKTAENETIQQTGIMNGTEYGPMKRIDAKEARCPGWSYTYDLAAAEIDSSSGDSGCPTYDVKNGEAYIVALHSSGGETTSGTDCEGNDITRACLEVRIHAS